MSVVVPSFEGVGHLGACLDSLAAQTMDPDLFEVIVVLNGTPDGSRELVAERAAAHPRITWRVAELLDHPGVGRARNAGIALARRAFIALVDDDDTLTPDYLAALYAHADWDVVPMAWLDDVAPDGTVNEATPVNRTMTRIAGHDRRCRAGAHPAEPERLQAAPPGAWSVGLATTPSCAAGWTWSS